jgi:hypothetical protein
VQGKLPINNPIPRDPAIATYTSNVSNTPGVGLKNDAARPAAVNKANPKYFILKSPNLFIEHYTYFYE